MNNYIIGDYILYLAKIMKSKSEMELMPHNIGIGQLKVLLLFYRNHSHPINQSFIAKTLDIDKANISRAVNKLISKGYLTMNDNGNLKNEIRLTKEGLNIKDDIFLAFRKVYDAMTQGISKEELDSLQSILSRMKDNIS